MVEKGAKRTKPGASSFERMNVSVDLSGLLFWVKSGILIRRRKMTATTPMGRLM
jgi:hypothetical protein